MVKVNEKCHVSQPVWYSALRYWAIQNSLWITMVKVNGHYPVSRPVWCCALIHEHVGYWLHRNSWCLNRRGRCKTAAKQDIADLRWYHLLAVQSKLTWQNFFSWYLKLTRRTTVRTARKLKQNITHTWLTNALEFPDSHPYMVIWPCFE